VIRSDSQIGSALVRHTATALLIAALLMVFGALANSQPSPAIDQRPGVGQPDPRLRRGVNLSHWFAQSHNGYGQPHLSSFITDRDIEQIRNAGFTHVRLPISMERSFGVGAERDAYIATLVEKTTAITRSGLSVIIDVHPGQDEKQALIEQGDATFVEGWRRLARAFSGIDARSVLFELMNEPTPISDQRWQALQERTIAAIRTVAPHNTLIANPGGWNGIDSFAGFSPYADANVIYSVHIYEPLLFTHQGATWSWDIASQVKGLEWPLPADAARQQSLQSGTTDDARKQLQFQISGGQFEARWLIDRLDRLVQWQQSHGNPPVYVGEFGVYRLRAPSPARLRWHRDMRRAFEARGWGWAVWDYAGGFGVTRSPAQRTLDAAMMNALGLLTAETRERHGP